LIQKFHAQQKLRKVQNQCNNKHCHEHSSLWQDQHQFLKTKKICFALLLALFIFKKHHQAHSYQPISNDRQKSPEKKTFATIIMLHEKCHNKS